MVDDDFHYDIFLSFNEHDQSKVREIREQLTAAGLRVFFRADQSQRESRQGQMGERHSGGR